MKATIIYRADGDVKYTKIDVSDSASLHSEASEWLAEYRIVEPETRLLFIHFDGMLLEEFVLKRLREVNTGIEI